MAGDAARVGVGNRHGFVGVHALYMLVVLSGDDEQMRGDVVFPIVLAVSCYQTFAETCSGLCRFELMAIGTGDLGFWSVRHAYNCLRMLGHILLRGMAALAIGAARSDRILTHLMLE